MDTWLAIAGGLALLTAATAKWADRLPISIPLLGTLAGVVLGPQVLGLLELPSEHGTALLSNVARATLAISLMAIALRFPLATVLEHRRRVTWLLLVVLPGMIGVTSALAAVTLGVGAGLALVLGAALAPTDPVLASSVLSGGPAGRTIPLRLRVGLSLESGANDGLALPLVLLTATAVTAATLPEAGLRALWSVVGAVVLGALVGWLAGTGLMYAETHGGTDRSRAATFSLVLALAVLGLGALVRTADLLGVFVAGLALNGRISSDERSTEELVDESVDRILILPLFLLVGAVLPWQAWDDLGWGGIGLAAGVLLLRRLPLLVLLRGPLRLGMLDSVWLGWFGPIGVAAIFYLTHLETLGVTEPVVWHAGSLVVAASIVAHGVTASPGRALYGRATSRARDPSEPGGR